VGTRARARKAPATFRRRSVCLRPRCGTEPRVRRSSGSQGSDQRSASSAARRSAAWPRLRRRSGSPGTKTMQAPPGRGRASATTSAAQAARRHNPRSFQAPTTRGTGSSYSTAARARPNASRRPAHSPQRRTGHTVGAPQRSQTGGAIRRSPEVQSSQTCLPGREQTRQRCGSSRSSTSEHATASAVPPPCQLGKYSARSGRP
jgi:hypothetical protein